MSTKRSLNRCKSIWVVRTDYYKYFLAVSDYSPNLFSVWVKVNKHWAHILINTSAMRDFLSLTFAKRVKISLQKKSKTYKVTVIDDKLLLYNNRMFNYKIKKIRLQNRPHVWDMQFNILLISRHDVMLRLL